MKRLIRWGIVFGIVGLLGWAAAGPGATYWHERRRVAYRDAPVSRGTIVAAVNATGTVKPVRSVQVGAFVSGPIVALHADFNDEIKKGQLLAKIDPRLYEAAVSRDRAQLATRQAEVAQARAKLKQARRDEDRSVRLKAENPQFISEAELDQFRFTREALEAQLEMAETSVAQARAGLEQSEANLGYTEIRAPVDGIVIDRKIDPGQTVASQFQTPELFVVAPDMRTEMRVFASVDEADIGLIRQAQEAGQPARFTVDAYPDDLFQGTIYQIRKSATTTQNVVTYPVVVSAPNPDLKLLPGMTASLSFQLREASAVLRVPNAALRFYPQRDQVRPDDRPLLDSKAAAADDPSPERTASASEKAELRRRRNRRHVWVADGDALRAVAVVTGLSNNQFTELVEGDLAEGQALVTGVQTRN